MQTTYGTSRLNGLVQDCDKIGKPLKISMIILLILSAVITILLIVITLYNKYKLIDASKPETEKQKEIDAKKKYVDIGTYVSIGLSMLMLGTTFYALPNVNKVLSCPAQ